MTNEALPFDDSPADGGAPGPYGRFSTGILPSHVLKRLIRARREILATEEIADAQIQPASVDLRLGGQAYRVRASFLPGREKRVAEKLDDIAIHEIDLRAGAVLETGCVYVVPLIESLELSFGKNLVLDGAGRWLARRNLEWYERHAAWTFPAQDIRCHLKVRK